jgi:excisionase family DNA binding protein
MRGSREVQPSRGRAVGDVATEEAGVMTALELDDQDREDLGRAMALLRGWKSHRDKPMPTRLDALEKLCRRCVSLSVVVRAAVDDDTAKVENRSMTPSLWLTTRQVAESLNISDGLVRKKIREGDLHAVRDGKGFRVPRTEFERYVDEKEVEANA